MMEKKKNQGIVYLLFELLEKNRIPYLVLRNYENLPQKPEPGSDIDILIEEKNLKSYELILKRVIGESQTSLVAKMRHFNCLSYFIYQRKPFNFATWIDAFTKISDKSFVFADSEFLLQNRIWHKNGFYIMKAGAEAALLFAKEILSGHKVRKKYRLKIQNLVTKDQNNFVQALAAHFTSKAAKEMLKTVLNGSWEEVIKKRKKWWRVLIFNTILQKPLWQIFLFSRFLWGYFREYFRVQKGLSIAFIGPDGAGKTTLAREIEKRLAKLSIKKIHYYHGRVGFFPELGRIFKFFSTSDSRDLYPVKESPFNKLRAFLHLFYYGLEGFFSWPWIFWGKIRGKIFLFDRYFYDYLATSIHRQAPFWLFFIISKFIPHPDLTFIIYASPEVIYQRKKEWPVEELQKQLGAFQSPELLKLSKCFLIDNEKSLQTNLEKIEEKIILFLGLNHV